MIELLIAYGVAALVLFTGMILGIRQISKEYNDKFSDTSDEPDYYLDAEKPHNEPGGANREAE